MNVERLLLTAVGTCLGLVLGVVLYGAALPTRWRVERSVIIDAPPALIHPLVESPRAWIRWVNQGTNVAAEPYGAERGVGAGMRWASGGMEVVQSDPTVGIRYEAQVSTMPPAQGSIFYQLAQGGTQVTWVDEGDFGRWPLGGYLVGRIERTLGPQVEGSLRVLKLLAERQAAPTPP